MVYPLSTKYRDSASQNKLPWCRVSSACSKPCVWMHQHQKVNLVLIPLPLAGRAQGPGTLAMLTVVAQKKAA